MGKHNKGRYKTRAVASSTLTTAAPDAASTSVASIASLPSADTTTQSDERMSLDNDAHSDTTLPSAAPLPPTISLSRPFHPPQPSLLPPLASASAPALTAITLPAAVPASLPLSGRTWRNPTQQKPTRSLAHSHHSHKGWTAQQAERRQKAAVRVKASVLAEVAKGLRLAEKRKREQRAAVKAENEKKNRIVQVIKDSSKIKRMSRAQLKLIEKA